MIPEFPEFKKLELSDKEEVEKITSKFPPYSDFNFVSMWSWNIENKIWISQLYGNLVVHFTDYLTDGTFLSSSFRKDSFRKSFRKDRPCGN